MLEKGPQGRRRLTRGFYLSLLRRRIF